MEPILQNTLMEVLGVGFQSERRYMGNTNQVFRIFEYRMIGGYSDGIHGIDVTNGSKLDFGCTASRCLDLHYLRFKGYNLGFLTSAGDVSPQYYDDRELGWLKSFTAGFLTTCGLKNIGLPCNVNGRHYGLHGHIGNTPAEQVSAKKLTGADGAPFAEISGVMYDRTLGGETLELHRIIRSDYGGSEIEIRDKVTNTGFGRSLHMILYHFNIGYPLLTERTIMLIPARKTIPRDVLAAKHADDWKVLVPPIDGDQEMCYYHDLMADNDGNSLFAAYNPDIQAGVVVRFSIKVLDHFVQWRQMAAGYYVTGLEPANATIDGIEDAMQKGSAKYLGEGECVEYNLRIQLLDNEKEFEGIKAELENFN